MIMDFAPDAQVVNRLPPVSILISPPEAKPFDSFGDSFSSTTSRKTQSPVDSYLSENTLPPIRNAAPTADSKAMEGLPSPPISPWTPAVNKTERRQASPAGASVPDPQLFSRDDSTEVANEPLFPSEPADPDLDTIVANHIAAVTFPSSKLPTADEYKLALSCKSIVLKRYNMDPRGWLREERRIIQNGYPGMRRVGKQQTYPKFARLAPAPSNGVKKSTGAKGSRAVRTPTTLSPRAPKPARSFMPTPRVTPKAPRVIGTNRDDVDFDALPDYAPPLSTLPSNPNILKVDWKGQVLDLSYDPHRHLLHEAEVKLAASLRLSCATYLCSKRRIFQARLEAMRIGKEFRKTDAQQACKIDVNKASKLWTAYDKVGWFNPSFFRQSL